MRIRDCFTIPEGQKATEKAFGRVLLASVCSVFLCMACLVGTTLAWFTVSVENPGNVIEIAVPEVSVSEETDSTEPALKRLTFTHNNDPDDFGSHGNIYVTVHFYDVNLKPVYFLLNADTYSIKIEKTISYTYEVSWSAPSNTDPYDGNPILLPKIDAVPPDEVTGNDSEQENQGENDNTGTEDESDQESVGETEDTGSNDDITSDDSVDTESEDSDAGSVE